MKNNYKKKRWIFLASVFSVSVVALIFVISNFRDQIVFFYSPSELKSLDDLSKIVNKQIRVGGLVVEKSVTKIDALTTKFVITDLKDELKITYSGLVPDLFRENQGVVAKGRLDRNKNQFIAEELLVKHDEKYMPPEVAKSLKKEGSAIK